MAAIQPALVDGSGNIAVHGRAALVIVVKFGTATPGTYRDISTWDLFFEVSGRFRVALEPGADVYSRKIVVTNDLVDLLPLDTGVPFDVRNETPELQNVPWSGEISTFGYRNAPPGDPSVPGTLPPVSGATVIVETINGEPVVIVQDPAAYDAGQTVIAEIIALGAAIELAIAEAGIAATEAAVAAIAAAQGVAVAAVGAQQTASIAAVVAQQTASVQAVVDQQVLSIAAVAASATGAADAAIVLVNAARDDAIAAVNASVGAAVAAVVAQQVTSVSAVEAAGSTAIAALALASAANYYATTAALVAAALPVGSYGIVAGGTGLFGTLYVVTGTTPFYSLVSTYASGQVTIDTLTYLKALLGADTTVTPLTTVMYPDGLTPTTGSNSVINNSYGPNVVITERILLTEVGVYLQTSGAVEFRHRRAEVDAVGNFTGLDTLDNITTLTPTAGAGLKVFGYADGLPQIELLPGDTVLLKMTVGRAAVLAGGSVSQRRSAGVDNTTLGQTGLAAVPINVGEQVQMYFKGVRVASGQSFDSRIDALETNNTHVPAEDNNTTLLLYRQAFTTTSFPTGWVANGWNATTVGATAPSVPGWAAILQTPVKQVFGRLRLRARVTITDTTAAHGIIVSAIESGNPNGGAYVIDGAASNLKIYSANIAGTTGTLRVTSGPFTEALVTGQAYTLAVDKDYFSTTVTLINALSQAVVCTVNSTMQTAADAGSRARATGTIGYLYLTGAAAGVTLLRASAASIGSPAGQALFLGDSNTEGPLLGADYLSAYPNQIAAARGNDGSVTISARGGDDSAALAGRLQYCAMTSSARYGIVNIGTNDGQASIWQGYMTGQILPALRRRNMIPVVTTIIPRTGVGSSDQIKNNAINAIIFSGALGSDVIVVDLAAALSLNNDRQTPNPALYVNPTGDNYTHMNVAGQNAAVAQFRVDLPAVFDRSAPSIPVTMPINYEGKPLVGEVFPRLQIPWGWTVDASGCVASCQTTATATATFTLSVNGTSIGSVVFSAGQATGVVTITDIRPAAGTFRCTAPSPADVTLADVSVTLSGYR